MFYLKLSNLLPEPLRCVMAVRLSCSIFNAQACLVRKETTEFYISLTVDSTIATGQSVQQLVYNSSLPVEGPTDWQCQKCYSSVETTLCTVKVLNRPSVVCFFLTRENRIDATDGHFMTSAEILSLCPVEISSVIRLLPADNLTYTLFACVQQESGPHFFNLMWSASANKVYVVNDDKISVASDNQLLECKHKGVLLFYKCMDENIPVPSFDVKTDRHCIISDTGDSADVPIECIE